MTDDRIVLPLSAVRRAVAAMDRALDCAPGDHATDCLGPLLEQRDLLVATEPTTAAVSGDCLDPVKHGACSGCICDCHRHSRRTT